MLRWRKFKNPVTSCFPGTLERKATNFGKQMMTYSGGCKRNLNLYGILGMMLLICLPLRSYSQVTINDRIVLSAKEQPAGQARSSNEKVTSSSQVNSISIKAQKSGMLQLYFNDAILYQKPITQHKMLKIRIINGEKSETHVIDISKAFGSPIMTPLEKRCGGNFYLYGNGNFSYNILRFRASELEDTYIDSRYTKANHGNAPEIDIIKNRTQGLVQFNLPSLPPDITIKYASLNMYALWATYSSDTYFNVFRVKDKWVEQNVTWKTRPTLSTSYVEVPAKQEGLPMSYFYPDISSFVKGWLQGTYPNNGVAITVPEDAPDTRMYLNSSDAYSFKPGFLMTFSTPGYKSKKIFEVGNVAKGDTVLISYVNDPQPNWAFCLSGSYTISVNGKSVDFERKNYFVKFNQSSACRPFNKYAEILHFYLKIGGGNIKLAMDIGGSRDIWPTLTEEGVQAYFDLNKVKNTKNDIVIKVTKSGEPLPDYPVTILTKWVTNSGGHDHDGSDDLSKPKKTQKGWIVNIEEADSAQGKLSTITNGDGIIKLRYRAPKFGGRIKLISQIKNGNGETLQSKSEIKIRVPDLVHLPNFRYYKKVGGTVSHHGPRLDSAYPNSREPDNNHWVNKKVRPLLLSLAVMYHDIYPTEELIRYNDISLVSGGLFDVFGKWTSPHILHRLGQNIDVRTSPPRGDGIPFVLLGKMREIVRGLDLKTTIEKHGSAWTDENGDYHDSRHFHIGFELF